MINLTKQIPVFGTPITPQVFVEQLCNSSFCISYFNRNKLGSQLDQLIRLCGDDQILILDNGAFSFWRQKGVNASEDYWRSYEKWAYSVLRKCPQAICIIPDVIDGTVDENAELMYDFISGQIPRDRMMAIWHLSDSLEYLEYLLTSFHYVGFGSTGEYLQPGTILWHKRIKQAFAIVDTVCTPENGFQKPWLHMLRAQREARLYPFNSSDSTNLAVNHFKHRHLSKHLKLLANKIEQQTNSAWRENITAQPTPVDHAIETCLNTHFYQWMNEASQEDLEYYFQTGKELFEINLAAYHGVAIDQDEPALRERKDGQCELFVA